MAPDNLDGKAGANGRPFEGATLRLHRIIRETMAAGDMQRHGDTTARRHGGTAARRGASATRTKIDNGEETFVKVERYVESFPVSRLRQNDRSKVHDRPLKTIGSNRTKKFDGKTSCPTRKLERRLPVKEYLSRIITAYVNYFP